MQKFSRLARQFLNGTLPLSQWRQTAEQIPYQQRYELETEIAARAQYYARLSAYLSRLHTAGYTRHGDGTIDERIHIDAVKAQNRAVAKVRAALGFAYNKSEITF